MLEIKFDDVKKVYISKVDNEEVMPSRYLIIESKTGMVRIDITAYNVDSIIPIEVSKDEILELEKKEWDRVYWL